MFTQALALFSLLLFFSYYPLFDGHDPYAHLFSDPASMTLWIEPIIHASTLSWNDKVELPTYFCSRFRLEPIQNATDQETMLWQREPSQTRPSYAQPDVQDLASLLQQEIRKVQRLEKIKKMAVFSVTASHGSLLDKLQFHSLSSRQLRV